jgi:flagellar basal-body rod protein FlgF
MEAVMLKGMIDPVRGMIKEQMRMDVISTNLANASSYGYKKTRIDFQEVLEVRKGDPESSGPFSDAGFRSLVRTEIDFSQGDFNSTGNGLDLAVHGEGFFKIMTADGIMYTRKGNFTLNGEGFLVTQNGDMVLGQGGPIQVTGDDVEINDSGEVLSQGIVAGVLDLASFENKQGLMAAGGSLFANAADEPEMPVPPTTGIKRGCLEMPNVEIAEEMVSMIHCMRAFETYQKAVQIMDDINQRAINDVSRVR